MNLKAETVLRWGDGDYLFALKLPQIEELQRLCGGVGIGTITNRVLNGEPHVLDIYHSIRLGLIGGGAAPVRAKELVDLYVSGQPLAGLGDPSSPLATAQTVLSAIYYGIEPEKEAPKDSPEGEPEAGTVDSSTSRPSKPRRSRRASAPAKSTA